MIIVLYLLLFLFNTALQSHYVFGGDSAEFALTAITWSIPHPPGYPFYSLLANIISKIPLYTVPWRVALISNVGAIVTAYFIYQILRLHTVSRIVSFCSSVLYLVLFPVWHYSLVPEVFTLNTALVSATTYYLFQFRATNNCKYVYYASLLIGLSVAHHHTFVLFIPAWIFITYQKALKLPIIARVKLVSFLLIGCAAYLYAPIASYFNPPLDWENAKTIDGFIRLFLRTAYGTFNAYSNSQSSFFSHAYDFIAAFLFILQDFKIPGVILLIVGGFSLRKMKKLLQLSAFIIISIITHIVFLTYTNFVLTVPFTTAMYERFLISLYYILTLLCAIAIHSLSQLYKRLQIVFIVFLIVYVAVVGFVNSKTILQIRSLKIFDQVAKDILTTVPKGGIVYAGTDNTNFPVQYYMFGLKKRPDVLFLPINHLNKKHELDKIKKDGRLVGIQKKDSLSAKDLEQLLALNENKGIYMEHPLPTGYWMPTGLLWKYYSTEAKATADIPNLLKSNKRLWESEYVVPVLSENQKNFLHVQVVQDLYREALKENSKLYFIAKEYAYSFTLLERAHNLGRSNKEEKATLLNIATHAKLCQKAKTYYAELSLYTTEEMSDAIKKALHSFEKSCLPK